LQPPGVDPSRRLVAVVFSSCCGNGFGVASGHRPDRCSTDVLGRVTCDSPGEGATMSQPDEKGRGPVWRAVTEVFAKGAPAPAKLALPLSLFLLPPALAAQEATGDDLPVVFTAAPPEAQVSEATVERLRAVTAIARLERVAALEPELNDLKYADPKAALMKLGIELPETVAVAVARDEAAGEDRVSVQGTSFETVLRFDADGQLIPSEEQAGGFASRENSPSPLDQAITCCFMGSPSLYCAVGKGICSGGADVCFSSFFSTSNGFASGYLDCSALGTGF